MSDGVSDTGRCVKAQHLVLLFIQVALIQNEPEVFFNRIVNEWNSLPNHIREVN